MPRIFIATAAAALLLAGCTQAEFQAANDALEQQMYATHGGPLGWATDAAVMGAQIQMLRGR